jgi:hypothetical protein
MMSDILVLQVLELYLQKHDLSSYIYLILLFLRCQMFGFVFRKMFENLIALEYFCNVDSSDIVDSTVTKFYINQHLQTL